MDIYTPIEEANEEIRRRWHDQELRKKVADYLGSIPTCFQQEPRAVLFRNIASPDLEFHHFVQQAESIGLKPLGLEYLHDRFCTMNADKICLAKLALFNGFDKNGKAIVSYRKIIDFHASESLKFFEITTVWRNNLVEFHYDLLQKLIPNTEIFDLSNWHHFNGAKAQRYYPYFLAFFVCHGVLFENFVTDGREQVFFENVFKPAFKEVYEIFDIKPLIIPAIAETDLNDRYWWCYPEAAKKEIHKYV